jgi:cell division protein FtsB
MALPKFKLKLKRDQFTIGIATILALLAVGGLTWGFGRQLMYARQMRLEEIRLEKIVSDEQAAHEALIERLSYVQSETYVERWAREELKMTRPGEILVIANLGSESDSPDNAQSDNQE